MCLLSNGGGAGQQPDSPQATFEQQIEQPNSSDEGSVRSNSPDEASAAWTGQIRRAELGGSMRLQRQFVQQLTPQHRYAPRAPRSSMHLPSPSDLQDGLFSSARYALSEVKPVIEPATAKNVLLFESLHVSCPQT